MTSTKSPAKWFRSLLFGAGLLAVVFFTFRYLNKPPSNTLTINDLEARMQFLAEKEIAAFSQFPFDSLKIQLF